MFENVAGEKVQQTRFLRSQQDLKAKFEERAAAGSEEGRQEWTKYKLYLYIHSNIWT